jgi:phosphotransferase system IIB component
VTDFADFSARLAANTDANVVFENSNGYQMIINHAAALASEEEILSRYQIPALRSSALQWGSAER